MLRENRSAVRCELIKDVPGYFTADPRRCPDAKPVASLSYDEARKMANAGCDLVQPWAIRAAAQTETTLIVRGLSLSGSRTIVSNHGWRRYRRATEPNTITEKLVTKQGAIR